VASYLVEAYDTDLTGDELVRAAHRAQLAAETLALGGTAIRLVHAIAIPGDDTWFLLYDAATADAAGEASRLAAIAFERIVEAQHVRPEHVNGPQGVPAPSARAARSRAEEER
jgi:hypothetical protein